MSNKMSVSTVINEGGREGVSRSLNGDFEVKTSGTNKKKVTLTQKNYLLQDFLLALMERSNSH